MKGIQYIIVLSKIIGTCDADAIYYSPGPDEFVDLYVDTINTLRVMIKNCQAI